MNCALPRTYTLTMSFNKLIFSALLTFSLTVGIRTTFGQQPTASDGPEAAWEKLSRTSVISVRNKATTTPAQALLETEAYARYFLDTATQAKNFYTIYPDHPKAKQARKLEALSVLRAVNSGAMEEEPRATRLGWSFRNDAANDESDRVEVALAMANNSVQSSGVVQLDDVVTQIEKKADSLVAEFPTNAEAYRMYLGLMRISPETKIRSLAQKVILAPSPDSVKREAQVFIDRLNLVGTQVPLEFTDLNNKPFNIADQSGQVVVAYAWTAQSSFNDSIFQVINRLPSTIVVLSINIDQDVAAAVAAAKQSNIRGIAYFDARGLKSPVAVRLKILDVPSFYVFGRDGKLAGYSSVEGLPALLAKAGVN